MKKLTTGQTNLLKEFNLATFSQDEPRTITRYNRFGMGSVVVNKLEAGLYDSSIAIFEQYERGEKANIAKADRLKYLLCKINSEAYMTLID